MSQEKLNTHQRTIIANKRISTYSEFKKRKDWKAVHAREYFRTAGFMGMMGGNGVNEYHAKHD